MFDSNYKFSCVDRFLQYVKIDTQSNEESESFPSDPKELDLSRILVEELKVNVEGLNVEEIRRIQQVQISYMQNFFFK